jgi:hypothetical protein
MQHCMMLGPTYINPNDSGVAQKQARNLLWLITQKSYQKSDSQAIPTFEFI